MRRLQFPLNFSNTNPHLNRNIRVVKIERETGGIDGSEGKLEKGRASIPDFIQQRRCGHEYTLVLAAERVNASSGLQHVHSYQEC
jgi:hypothetical protein